MERTYSQSYSGNLPAGLFPSSEQSIDPSEAVRSFQTRDPFQTFQQNQEFPFDQYFPNLESAGLQDTEQLNPFTASEFEQFNLGQQVRSEIDPTVQPSSDYMSFSQLLSTGSTSHSLFGTDSTLQMGPSGQFHMRRRNLPLSTSESRIFSAENFNPVETQFIPLAENLQSVRLGIGNFPLHGSQSVPAVPEVSHVNESRGVSLYSNRQHTRIAGPSEVFGTEQPAEPSLAPLMSSLSQTANIFQNESLLSNPINVPGGAPLQSCFQEDPRFSFKFPVTPKMHTGSGIFPGNSSLMKSPPRRPTGLSAGAKGVLTNSPKINQQFSTSIGAPSSAFNEMQLLQQNEPSTSSQLGFLPPESESAGSSVTLQNPVGFQPAGGAFYSLPHQGNPFTASHMDPSGYRNVRLQMEQFNFPDSRPPVPSTQH